MLIHPGFVHIDPHLYRGGVSFEWLWGLVTKSRESATVQAGTTRLPQATPYWVGYTQDFRFKYNVVLDIIFIPVEHYCRINEIRNVLKNRKMFFNISLVCQPRPSVLIVRLHIFIINIAEEELKSS